MRPPWKLGLGLLLVLMLLVLAAKASNFFSSGGKTMLQVDNCGNQACALPYLTPRVYFKVVSGQMPPKGSVLHCSPGKTDYDCGDGLHVLVEGIQFQGQY